MSTSNMEEILSSQSAADKIIAQLEKMETSLESEMQSISKRVRRLEEQAPQSPKRRATESSSTSWADRGTSGLESLTDCSWPISDDEEGDPSETETLETPALIQLSIQFNSIQIQFNSIQFKFNSIQFNSNSIQFLRQFLQPRYSAGHYRET